jgi:hypothetical protein
VALVCLQGLARNAYWKARFGAAYAILPGVFGGLAAWFGAYFLLKPALGDDPAAMVGMVLYLAGICVGSYFGLSGYGKRSSAEMGRASEHADARAIRFLTDMVRGNVWAGSLPLLPVLHAIVRSLSRILARITPSDRGLIDEGDLAGLRSILASCANHYGWVQAGLFTPEFIRIALSALQTLEDGEGLHLAERLSRAIGVGRKAAEVRRIAAESLPGLREVAERARERAELLRPVEAPGEPEAILLRPAETGTSSDPGLLVRPVGDE